MAAKLRLNKYVVEYAPTPVTRYSTWHKDFVSCKNITAAKAIIKLRHGNKIKIGKVVKTV